VGVLECDFEKIPLEQFHRIDGLRLSDHYYAAHCICRATLFRTTLKVELIWNSMQMCLIQLEIKPDWTVVVQDNQQIGPNYQASQTLQTNPAPAPAPFSDSGYSSAKFSKTGITQTSQMGESIQEVESFQLAATISDDEDASTANIYSEGIHNPAETDDTRTVYSNSSSMVTAARDNYITEFADGLLSRLRTQGTDSESLEAVYPILPRLLKSFALKIGQNAPSQEYRDIMVFVSKHRRYVVRTLDMIESTLSA
jgi:hypothetical protein